ncbi:MAG: GtrA family protein [Burkholderiaceae bacterium]|nr:GtrA family protein [Burkholderiaceae bacterium]
MKALAEVFRFGVVGAAGFLIDSAVLYLLRGALGLYYGRIGSFLAAVLVTWLLNRSWTFRARRSALRRSHEFAIYLLLMMLGGGVNYAVYAWLVSVDSFVAADPILGVAAGSVAGMFVNLVTSRSLLFRFRAS